MKRSSLAGVVHQGFEKCGEIPHTILHSSCQLDQKLDKAIEGSGEALFYKKYFMRQGCIFLGAVYFMYFMFLHFF